MHNNKNNNNEKSLLRQRRYRYGNTGHSYKILIMI